MSNARLLNTSSDAIDFTGIATAGTAGKTALTLSLWFEITSATISGTAEQHWLSQENTATGTFIVGQPGTSSGGPTQLMFYVFDTAQNYKRIITTGGPLAGPLTGTHNLTAKWWAADDTIALYLDGAPLAGTVSDSAGPISALSDTSESIHVGSAPGHSPTGLAISNVGVWASGVYLAYTTARVPAIINPASLLMSIPLDGSSPEVAFDASGTPIGLGTVVGTPSVVATGPTLAATTPTARIFTAADGMLDYGPFTDANGVARLGGLQSLAGSFRFDVESVSPYPTADSPGYLLFGVAADGNGEAGGDAFYCFYGGNLLFFRFLNGSGGKQVFLTQTDPFGSGGVPKAGWHTCVWGWTAGNTTLDLWIDGSHQALNQTSTGGISLSTNTANRLIVGTSASIRAGSFGFVTLPGLALADVAFYTGMTPARMNLLGSWSSLVVGDDTIGSGILEAGLCRGLDVETGCIPNVGSPLSSTARGSILHADIVAGPVLNPEFAARISPVNPSIHTPGSQVLTVGWLWGNPAPEPTTLVPSFSLPVAPFSPSALPDLALWLDASDTLYTNAAGTAPAGVDGDLILNAPDWSGAGNTLTRPSGTGAVLRIEGGARVIGFEGGYLNRDVTSGTVSAFSLHAFVKVDIPPTNNVLMAFGAGATGAYVAPNGTAVDGDIVAASIVPAGGGGCAPEYLDDPTYHALSLIYDGATVRTFLDGAEIGGYDGTTNAVEGQAANPNFTRDGLAVGAWAPGPYSFRGRLAELAYYEAAQTPAEVADFAAYFKSKWAPLLDTADPLVAWVTNSLGTPRQTSEASSIPYLCGSASAKVNRWVAACRAGITTTQMLSRVSLDYGKFAAGPGPLVAVVWEATNDIVHNHVSAAGAYANLVSLAQSLRSAGYTQIVMGTILPRTGVSDVTRGDLNTLIRGNSADWESVADVGGDATIGADGADTNVTYYIGDGIHLNAAGNTIAASIFRAAIEAVLP